MINKSKLRKVPFLKLILVGLVVVFTGLFIFKEDIKEHKVTKAKMEMLKRMLKSPPEEWDNDFKEVYDSLIIEKVDSTITKSD